MCVAVGAASRWILVTDVLVVNGTRLFDEHAKRLAGGEQVELRHPPTLQAGRSCIGQTASGIPNWAAAWYPSSGVPSDLKPLDSIAQLDCFLPSAQQLGADSYTTCVLYYEVQPPEPTVSPP